MPVWLRTRAQRRGRVHVERAGRAMQASYAGAASAMVSEVALVDPLADEGDLVASLRALVAKVKHHAVKNAVGANIRAAVAVCSLQRGSTSPYLFVPVMEAIAALCKEYSVEAIKRCRVYVGNRVWLQRE